MGDDEAPLYPRTDSIVNFFCSKKEFREYTEPNDDIYNTIKYIKLK